MVAKLVHYTGTVQGVGFRFTARNHARRHRITGYVNNLPNGQVELLAEGDDTDVKDFLADLREEMSTYIESVDIESKPVSGSYNQFVVRCTY